VKGGRWTNPGLDHLGVATSAEALEGAAGWLLAARDLPPAPGDLLVFAENPCYRRATYEEVA
jgi:hypothetical protein